MRFKYWFYINEAISEKDKNDVLNSKLYTNEKDLNIKSKLDQLLTNLEADKETYNKGEIFKKIQEIIPKIGIKKEKPKEEDAQRKHFASMAGITQEELSTYDYYKSENKDLINEMMTLLRRFVGGNIIKLKIENNKPEIYFQNEKMNSPDFTRFMSALHNIEGEIEEYSGAKGAANPLELALSHDEHLAAKGDKVWVFRGERPNICRLLGKGQKWCISSTSSATHWFSYRINNMQTQYFVFDFNKAEDDPARYVNPGVAPKGGYSEWVDARNKHKRDPNDRNSEVGINGYSSIEEYKDYLESKGIPKSTWQALPLQHWEERLGGYYNRNDFYGAKNDDDPRVFEIYLKIAKKIDDEDFNTLTSEQKKEFVLGRSVDDMTTTQINYALDNHRKEYHNSLDVKGKIAYGHYFKNTNLLYEIAKMPNLTEDDVRSLILCVEDKVKITEILGQDNLKKLHSGDINYLLAYAKNKIEMAQALGKDAINKFKYDINSVYELIRDAVNKTEMMEILGADNINRLEPYLFIRLIYFFITSGAEIEKKIEMVKLFGKMLNEEKKEKMKKAFGDFIKEHGIEV